MSHMGATSTRVDTVVACVVLGVRCACRVVRYVCRVVGRVVDDGDGRRVEGDPWLPWRRHGRVRFRALGRPHYRHPARDGGTVRFPPHAALALVRVAGSVSLLSPSALSEHQVAPSHFLVTFVPILLLLTLSLHDALDSRHAASVSSAFTPSYISEFPTSLVANDKTRDSLVKH